MRIAPISWAVGVWLAAILLAGAAGVVTISLKAGDARPLWSESLTGLGARASR